MIRVLSTFTGVGGDCWALKKAGVPHTVVGWSEIDKRAIQCFKQNFPEYADLNYGDISEIYKGHLPDFDLLTGGFPCQDVSNAGKRDLSQGRTNLYKQMISIAVRKQPKYILMENVKGLLTMKVYGRRLIDIIVDDFRAIGYGVAYKLLNSADYGVPQSRERVWIACRLGGWDFMKPNWNFKKNHDRVLKDVLEDVVDSKYYLSEKHIKRLLHSDDIKNGFSSIDAEIGRTQTKGMYHNFRGNYIQQLNEPKHSNNRVYDENGCSPTLRDMSAGGNRQPFIRVRDAVKKGYSEAKEGDGIFTTYAESETRRGRVQDQKIGTLQTGDAWGVIDKATIRKLTPRECMRLQGFLNDEINLKGLSDSAIYKLAGNGWEINVASKVLKSMLEEEL
jgi:DNA (cytosine-5)-methyltransferase 1